MFPWRQPLPRPDVSVCTLREGHRRSCSFPKGLSISLYLSRELRASALCPGLDHVAPEDLERRNQGPVPLLCGVPKAQCLSCVVCPCSLIMHMVPSSFFIFQTWKGFPWLDKVSQEKGAL